MACALTSGRKEPCKDSLGGLKKLYIAEFQPFRRYQFGIVDNVLTSIPTTFVHLFELRGTNNFEESYNGETYTQKLTLQFKKQDVPTSIQMETLNYIELRALIQDYNGNWLILGLENGLESDGLEIVSGDAHGSFNGYRLTLTGREKESALFVLDPFTNGFIDVGETEEDFKQFQNLDAFEYQNGDIMVYN